MTSELDQLYQDQIIICKGLSLLKVMGSEFLSKEEQERLPYLSEKEMQKLVMLEKEVENEQIN